MGASDALGGSADRVELELAGEVIAAKSYQVAAEIFRRPAAFAVTLPHFERPIDAIKRYPPRTPFKLRINGRVQFEGFTDGDPEVDRSANAPTQITVHGRDLLSALLDTTPAADAQYKDQTPIQIVEAALRACGLTGKLVVDDSKARRNRAGVSLARVKEKEIDRRPKQNEWTAHVGQSWDSFIHGILEHNGLFLWQSQDHETGKAIFVLSKPDTEQAPLYRIVGSPRDQATVLGGKRKNDTTKRFSEVLIVGRAGGKKAGRTKKKGHFDDDEMVAWGYDRLHVERDGHTLSDEEAEFFAKRKVAQSRREGFFLEYPVYGHTVPALGGGRAIWTPNTMVELSDPDVGEVGRYWLEGCAYHGAPTTTTLRLMRPAHLVF